VDVSSIGEKILVTLAHKPTQEMQRLNTLLNDTARAVMRL